MFRRRDNRSWHRILLEVLWPRGGWLRAARYVQHRMSRLPGTPQQIARGVFAGTFVVFTPFFGFHFILAALFARLLNGSILAALLATFVGNPLTYVPIAVVSLQFGHFLLGSRFSTEVDDSLGSRFSAAAGDLWHNFKAIFTTEVAHWDELITFWNSVMLPWTVGGLLPGIATGLVAYWLSLPVIGAYQRARAARVRKKLEKMEKLQQETRAAEGG